MTIKHYFKYEKQPSEIFLASRDTLEGSFHSPHGIYLTKDIIFIPST